MNKELTRIIITGSNKGIGLGIVEQLSTKPYHIIMACRSLDRANEARQKILSTNPNSKIDALELDLDSTDSINKFVQKIQNQYGQIDILLNNSGIANKGEEINTDIIESTFRTNFYGTIDLTEKLLPFIKDHGKIIFVGSTVGKYYLVQENKTILSQLQNPNLTRDQLFGVAKQFYDDVKDNTYQQKGWVKSPYFVYAVSKLCINHYPIVLSRHQNIISKNIQVYGCCPGWVRTDLGGYNAHRSIEEGVVCPIYLVELPFQVNPQFQGKFFYDSVVTSL